MQIPCSIHAQSAEHMSILSNTSSLYPMKIENFETLKKIWIDDAFFFSLDQPWFFSDRPYSCLFFWIEHENFPDRTMDFSRSTMDFFWIGHEIFSGSTIDFFPGLTIDFFSGSTMKFCQDRTLIFFCIDIIFVWIDHG